MFIHLQKEPHAYSNGATEAAKRFTQKLGFLLMRSIKKANLTKWSEKRLREEEISELPIKIKGRPLLGRKLDEEVQEYVLKLRDHGYPINTFIVIAVAKGLGEVMDLTRLAKYGGPATLTVPWAKSLLKRMDFTKRRATTMSNPLTGDLVDIKQSLLAEVFKTLEFNDISPELIFKWDQTGINLVQTAMWTMDKKGKKRIAIEGHQDKRQITAVMCGSLVGDAILDTSFQEIS